MPESGIEQLASEYRRQTGIEVYATDTQGNITLGASSCRCGDEAGCRAQRRRAIEQTARWGEPFLSLCPGGYLLWAVPLMINSEITGGLVVDGIDLDESKAALPCGGGIRQAAMHLQKLAEEANLTNAAYLQLKRRDSEMESQRAEAIHELKGRGYDSIREIYIREEPGLISAIKRSDLSEARAILNRILVGIYFFGRNRTDLLKSFILELVVTMSRSAVEAGGDPSELLGVNYSSVTGLAAIDSEEELTAWLVGMLERIMESIRTHASFPTSVLVNTAMAFAEEHLSEDISRDQIAAIACLSPSHFSRVVKEKFGKSFTEILTGLRIARARDYLATSEKSLVQVCLDCGFSDQSYFTKVFQRHVGCTPGEYRHRVRGSLR
jgi:AraC-like DNA-binding protein